MDTGTVMLLLKPQVIAKGLPEATTTTFMDAVADAGLGFIDEIANTTAAANEPTETKRLQATGFPGVFVCGAKVGTRGWLAWLEFAEKGVVTRTPPVFLEGSGTFNPA